MLQRLQEPRFEELARDAAASVPEDRARPAGCGSAALALGFTLRASTVPISHHRSAAYASGSRLNMRMPLIIVLITVEPRVMSSRNTMYVWIIANSSM